MFRCSTLLLILAPAIASAQQPAANQPARFKWEANQVHTYKVSQQTTVRETTLDEKTEKPVTTEAKTSLTLVKKWTVKAVDASGVGTLEMTIAEMRTEFRKPDGTALLRDSANPEHAKEMVAYLNVPIVAIKVDPLGKLLDVKEAKAGSASRLHAELPFRVTLPEGGLLAGQKWDRTFSQKLDPPLGTGESYEFSQKYAAGAKDGLLVIGVETTLKVAPKTLAERVPLVPMLWGGEVHFNPATGRYQAARLKVNAELPNHQGEGTKFEYESLYSEDLVK